MTRTDLRQFKAVQHHLDDKQKIQTMRIKTVGAPDPSETHGGPVFMSIGQVIQLDIVSEKARLLADEPVPSDAGAAVQSEDSVATEAKIEVKSAVAQESTTAEASPAPSEASSTTASASTEKQPAEAAPKISAGINQGDQAPIATHSTPKSGTKGDRFLFTESPVEYYYYHQPIVQKIQPKQGLTTGGTPIEISGAFFDERLDYGVIPFCKIGDKIKRAQFFSTVRIVCYSPPNNDISAALPVSVSLNGVDWVDTGFFFSYYTEPELLGLTPASGPYQGGTEVMLKGNLFAQISEPGMVKCKFTLKTGTDGFRPTIPKTMPAFYIDANTMMCLSPNGFIGGDKVYVQLTFNDMDYTPLKENMVFNFYAIFGSFPHSGPADGFN